MPNEIREPRKRTYTIVGNTPAQKNSKKIYYNKATHRPILVTEKRVKDWQEDALWQLKTQIKENWSYPVGVAVTFYWADNRQRDIDNALSTILDILKNSQIISDDSTKYVQRVSAVYGGYDKTNPRAETTIKEM